ncbi:MAG TPA: SusC/RagA family TonB-linked outer membrane protein [Gemmatimonadaceae bacterium]|nr:SusC/RagA family TonB-linked outer membrane protein [Gemmatimonadaceae bacterium]
MRGRLSLGAALLLATAALVAAPGTGRVLEAQEAGTIAGTVSAEGSREALAGAQIVVTGGTQRAETDDRGRFRLTGFTQPVGTTVTLEVRRIGYNVVRVPARVGDTNVGVSLHENPVSLEQVVVTGTAGATEKREIGNAVTTVNAAAVVQTAPISNMQQLLNGRAPGVVIMPTSGAVGTGSQVRVRGLASFSLGNGPLLYVDGVRVNNDAATGPANQAFGSSSISRLNDINPEDIESIEILKGPSAATLYGTEASNGVINIITKKGASGAARWSAVVRQGVNYLQDWKTRFPTNYGPIHNADGSAGPIVAVSMDSLIKADGGDLFRNGRHQETQLTVNGGTSTFNYYASGNLMDSQGAEPTNNTRKYSTRLNVGLSPSPKLHLSGDVGYITGPTYLSAEAGYGGRVWTTLLATPKTYNTWQEGFYSSIPRQYDKIYKFWQDLNRFTGSVKLEHQPLPWLQHRLTIGYDRTGEGNNYYQPRIDSLYYSFGSDAYGYRELDGVTTVYKSLDYNANATWNPAPAYRFTTAAGAQYYHTSHEYLQAWGSIFPPGYEGLSSVAATTSSPGQYQDYTEDATLGYYGQEQFGWRDRLFLTAALRWDNSSAFGSKVNQVVYPKYSLSWVLSDEPLFANNALLGHFSSFRLRAAYGEAGKAPGTYDAVPTYIPATGPNGQPAVTLQSIGNPNLGPERGKEYELGFDAAVLQDRLGAEVTYYHKKTTDAILFKQVAPSTGFPGTQPFNAGSILNKGWEIAIRGTPVRNNQITWDLNASIATNDNKVLSLLPGTNFVTAGTYLRHTVGFPAFGWWERRLVSAQVNPDGTGIKSSMLCDDGKGGTTPCYNSSGSLVAPLVYLGRSVPPTEGSVSTTLGFLKNFSIYTQVDFKHGQKKMDGNTRVRCTFFGGRCPENFTSAFPVNTLDPVRTAEINSNRSLVDFLITNASFAKWRELTLSYNVPERFARMANLSRAQLSVSGRNLHTWTSYQGFEPEAMFLGGSRGGNAAWEQTTLPQLTSWIVSLSLGL